MLNKLAIILLSVERTAVIKNFAIKNDEMGMPLYAKSKFWKQQAML